MLSLKQHKRHNFNQDKEVFPLNCCQWSVKYDCLSRFKEDKRKQTDPVNLWHVLCKKSMKWDISSPDLHSFFCLTDHPERAALFFVCGVCLGLFLTLFALVVQISCRTDCQPRPRPPVKKRARPADSSSDSSDSDSDWDTTSDLSARRHRRFERTLNMNVFTSAEELERAQRLEERERIIREIWMNGQPDIPGTRSLNRYYWRLLRMFTWFQ